MGHSILSLRCQRSKALSELAAKQLGSLQGATIRCHLALASVSLAHEHHSGLSMLMYRDHYASAAAMLRPIAEASVRAHWLIYAADARTIETLASAQTDTPNLDSMIRALAKCTTPPEGISDLQRLLPTADWRRFHKYNHGGIHQLRRRQREETFGLEECHEHLLLADFFLLGGVSIGTVLGADASFSSFVSAEYGRANHESVHTFGKPDTGPWKGLPSPPRLDP